MEVEDQPPHQTEEGAEYEDAGAGPDDCTQQYVRGAGAQREEVQGRQCTGAPQ